MSDGPASLGSLGSVSLPLLLPGQENLFSSLVFAILQRDVAHKVGLMVHRVISRPLPVQDSLGDYPLVGAAGNSIDL